MNLVSSLITDVPGWPKPGVVFEDIIPLPAPPEGFRQAVNAIVASAPETIDMVVRMEVRGFTFAALAALALGAGFVPVRKPGKLPRPVLSESFDLKYGTATLTIHTDALITEVRILAVDDVLATGSTVAAMVALLKRLNAELVHMSVLLELIALDGRKRLANQGISNCSAVLTG